MKLDNKASVLSISILIMALSMSAAPSSGRVIEPVPSFKVQIDDPFWSPRWEINHRVTIPHCIAMNRKTGDIDSTVMFKTMEAAAYTLAAVDDPELQRFAEKWIDDLVVKILPGESGKTWMDLGWENKLYAAGHFFEAACACYKSLGNKKILDAAVQIADRIDSIYGSGKRHDSPGHAEIEPGLARLFRATGDERYIRLARFFLDQRGRAVEFFGRRMHGEYYQDHVPASQQHRAAGHAVSALYMYMGMADVAGLMNINDFNPALGHIWEDIANGKFAITGGIGARRLYEGFGDEFELPNFICWNETCAAIASMMWNHRMFLNDPDAKYIDLLEKSLYNGFLSGVSLKGDRFFYQNPLQSFGDDERSDWFGVACCPPNLARMMASLGGYIYAKSGRDVYINLFIGSRAEIRTNYGIIRMEQETKLPWDGAIRITVEPEQPDKFSVFMRIPSWAGENPLPGDLYRHQKKFPNDIALKVNGKSHPMQIEKGFIRISREWKKHDTIELELPLPVRRVLAHPNVISGHGRVALERGPVVYCAEWPDNDGHILSLLIPDDAALNATFRNDLLQGVGTITGTVQVLGRGSDGNSVQKNDHQLVAVPYFAWANRGKGEMAVWLAREVSKTLLPPTPTIASTSRISSSPSKPSGAPGIGNHKALIDQMEPDGSSDDSFSFFRLIPEEGDTGWVQFDFKDASTVSAVEVFWLDDHRFCVQPDSWRILYKENGQWKPVANHRKAGVVRDAFNRVDFDPIHTTAIRLEINPRKRIYFNGQIGPPAGSFISNGAVEWYECGIIEVRILPEK